jgi:uncharacterized phage protein (TIGR01671 family)
MRIIKFRYWDVKNKKLIYSGEFVNFYEFFERAAFIEDQSQQFVGEYDKTGKEIYDGDILEYEYGEEILLVQWSQDFCRFDGLICLEQNGYYEGGKWVDVWKEPDYDCSRTFDELGECKIIGNIHENPELLNANRSE